MFISNRVLRKICGPKEKGENIRERLSIISYTICPSRAINCDQAKKSKNAWSMWHVWGKKEFIKIFGGENCKKETA
jgi:hypothetical protein